MMTVRDLSIHPKMQCGDLINPLYQDQLVWKVVPTAHLTNGYAGCVTRPQDPTGILDDIAKTAGTPTAMCVLGDNVIGAASWEGIPMEAQYRAVTEGAGAFVASNMHYLSVTGPDAANAMNMLTPRDVQRLPVGGSMFTLFTTPAGTVDEEAIVLRTGQTEYLVSCGGGKPLSWLPKALQEYPEATAEQSEIVSFNIKGPGRMRAMQALVHPEDRDCLASLRPFQSSACRNLDGDPVRVVRTVVGYEMWGHAAVIRRTWGHILQRPDLATPCAWDLLNVYRLECTSMVFAVYPLDVHAGTTLWEAGYGWMIEEGEDKYYVGKEALENSVGAGRCRLAGLMARSSAAETPPVGTEVRTRDGGFAGFVTSSAYSIKHGRSLAFAHLQMGQQNGAILEPSGYGDWSVCALPFKGS